MKTNENKTALGMLFGFVGVLIFGGTVPATRLAVADLDPWFVTFGRAAIAGTLAAIVLLVMRRTLPRVYWLRVALASLCLVVGFPGFLGIALQTVPAAHSGVVLGLLPIATAMTAVIVAGERPSLSFWLWSVLGAILVSVFAFRDGTPGWDVGDFWLICAVITAASGYSIAGKLSREKPGWEVICWQLIIASPAIIVGTIYFWDDAIFTARPSAHAGFAYAALFSMFIGFFAWNTGLAWGGIARVSQIQLLQTYVTLAIAGLILGEAITLEAMGFATAIIAIIWFASRSRIKT